METTLKPSIHLSIRQQKSDSQSLLLHIPAYVYAVVFASLCVVIGLIWDICWHKSIGRDGLLSPPHLVVYLGAVVSGLFSGYEVLRVSFWGNASEKAERVKIWGIFYSSLGALFCIWGALTMLTSAPFDDWWHNTYGLDVTILSPPHSVLAMGIGVLQFGAIVGVLAQQNKTTALSMADATKRAARLRIMFILSAGLMMVMQYTLLSEQLDRWNSHHSLFYKIAGAAFPVFLAAYARAMPGRWTLSAIAGVYMLTMCVLLWVIPIFPAEPKLGPILYHSDHYQAFQFPIMLIAPALVMDMLFQRFSSLKISRLALIMGIGFIVPMVIVQWYFGGFLHESPLAQNWVFGSHYWYFGADPNWEYRNKFAPWSLQTIPDFLIGILWATAFSIASAYIGLIWGKWMNRIQR
jgi:hypothetical protein